MFGVLIETSGGDDEVGSEVVRWLRENAGEIGEEDVQAVHTFEPLVDPGRVVRTGTRVKLAEEIVVDEGTVVDISARPGTPLTLDIRLDNGALCSVHLDEIEVLDQAVRHSFER